MNIRTHDTFHTFDYVAFVNAVYFQMIEHNLEPQLMAEDLKVSAGFIYKFFRYECVSMPSLIILARYADVDLFDFIIYQD